ncbi:MAG TPA: GNAT family N-acetyltransferase [Candidatus Faecaligallichristensenella faecipullorum]|nr:GNAT family N-acetyltransferase [Candidatus Faecaligallichristensenella faecipullorum]
MIRIKGVDAQNMWDVCQLTTNPNGIGTTMEAYICCNALSIAESKYDPEMHPNVIYSNHVLIGFFMYRRPEDHAGTATLCRFMIDYRFQHKGLGKKALEYVLKGLKIQGVKKVILMIHGTNTIAQKLCLSCGFQFTGKNNLDEWAYEAEL